MLPPCRSGSNIRTSFLHSRLSRAVSSSLCSRFPSSADAVESYSRSVSKVVRYRRERMPMESERKAQAEPFRLLLASSFLPHCHAACGEAALPLMLRTALHLQALLLPPPFYPPQPSSPRSPPPATPATTPAPNVGLFRVHVSRD